MPVQDSNFKAEISALLANKDLAGVKTRLANLAPGYIAATRTVNRDLFSRGPAR